MKIKKLLIASFFLLMLQIPFLVYAQEDGFVDFQVFGLELEKLLNLGSGILAATLFLLTIYAYKRTKRDKLIFISVAFLLFSIKSLMMGIELFIDEIIGVDPITAILDFAILISFFYGVIKK
jgi:hypothetical protein